MSNSVSIRSYRAADWPALWPILKEAIRTGDTFAWAPESTEQEMHEAWVDAPQATYVAEGPNGRLLGAYFIKPNQPGLGSHVCNAGYCVAVEARGQGVAASMCEHSQVEAKRAGFRSMQFNIVVATNAPAVHLWKKLGFAIVGTLPGAFQHAQHGSVDAHVMYKHL